MLLLDPKKKHSLGGASTTHSGKITCLHSPSYLSSSRGLHDRCQKLPCRIRLAFKAAKLRHLLGGIGVEGESKEHLS